jgi:hypothetical protein
MQQILGQNVRVAAAERQLGDMQEAHRTIEKEPLPEFPGLSIDGRRYVNLSVIAYAQHLFARLAASGLAMDARLANYRSVESARHGNLEACLARLREIAQALALVDAQDGLAAEIRKRGEKMGGSATWRNASETVPQPASLPPAATGGVPDANVLVEQWGGDVVSVEVSRRVGVEAQHLQSGVGVLPEEHRRARVEHQALF